MNLDAFIEISKQQQLAVRGLQVYQHGQRIAVWQPCPEERQNQFSVTKSFTSTAIGLAIGEGRLSLEDYVLDYFKEEAPAVPSDNLRKMQLRHLITMSMGWPEPMFMTGRKERAFSDDWVRYCLSQPVVNVPGSTFLYSNAGPYLLGIILQRLTGQTLREYLTPRLFEPLGMEMPGVELDPKGMEFGASSFELTVSDIAKLGLLYLQHGLWEGRQIIPAEWTEEVCKPRIDTNGDGDALIGHDYGYLFWVMPEGTFRADGMYEQYSIVIPSRDAVIAVNAHQTTGNRDILHAVMTYIVPEL